MNPTNPNSDPAQAPDQNRTIEPSTTPAAPTPAQPQPARVPEPTEPQPTPPASTTPTSQPPASPAPQDQGAAIPGAIIQPVATAINQTTTQPGVAIPGLTQPPHPQTPSAAPQQPVATGGPAALHVESLRVYEQSQRSGSSAMVIKDDPEMRKKLIIAGVMIFTVILIIPGVIMLFKTLSKASSQSKNEKESSSKAMYQQFAQQNGLRLLESNDPLLNTANPDLIDQYIGMEAKTRAQMPGFMSALGDTELQEPAVTGTLPGGSPYILYTRHLDVAISGSDSLLIGADTSAFSTNLGGVRVGTGDVFNSPMAGLQSAKNALQDKSLFTVTRRQSTTSGSNINRNEVTISGSYSYLTLSILAAPEVIIPHLLLQPIHKSFAVPIQVAKPYELELEGNFNDVFRVWAIDGYQTEALQILEPNVMAQLMDDMSGLTLELVGNRLNIHFPLKPYTTQTVLADAVEKLYELACRQEAWFKKELGNWHFQPQPTPYNLQFGGFNERMVSSDLEQVDKSNVTWR